jgi:toxin CcdB
MAQFDVYHTSIVGTPYLVDVQSDLLSLLETRMVIPLTPILKRGVKSPLGRLTPVIEVFGSEYLLNTPKMAAVFAGELTSPVANVGAANRQQIVGALDFLIQGF